MSGTPRNCCRSGVKSSGCSLATFNVLIADMEGHVYLGGAHELIEILDCQDNIVGCNVTIHKNDPFASKHASATTVFRKAKKLRTESSDLIWLKDSNQPSYTGFPQINNVIDAQWKLTEELFGGMVSLCDSQIVDSDKLSQAKNQRGHNQDQIGAF